METYLFWIVPIASLLALVLAWYFYKQMMRESEGTPTMEKIALYVRQGAMSYLKQQYKVVGMVFLGLVILFSVMAYGFHLQNAWVPVAFLTGGFLVQLLRDDMSPAQRTEVALHTVTFFRRLGQVEIAGVFQVRTLVEVAFKGTAQETHVVLL